MTTLPRNRRRGRAVRAWSHPRLRTLPRSRDSAAPSPSRSNTRRASGVPMRSSASAPRRALVNLGHFTNPCAAALKRCAATKRPHCPIREGSCNPNSTDSWWRIPSRKAPEGRRNLCATVCRRPQSASAQMACAAEPSRKGRPESCATVALDQPLGKRSRRAGANHGAPADCSGTCKMVI
jgi:hypothetical protein